MVVIPTSLMLVQVCGVCLSHGAVRRSGGRSGVALLDQMGVSSEIQ